MKLSVFIEHNKKALIFLGVYLLLNFASLLIIGGQMQFAPGNGGLYLLGIFILFVATIMLYIGYYYFKENYVLGGAGAFLGLTIVYAVIGYAIQTFITFIIGVILGGILNNEIITAIGQDIGTLLITPVITWVYLSLITSSDSIGARISYGFTTIGKVYWKLLLASFIATIISSTIPMLLAMGVITNMFVQSIVEGLLFIIGSGGLLFYELYLFFTRGRTSRFREIELEIKEDSR